MLKWCRMDSPLISCPHPFLLFSICFSVSDVGSNRKWAEWVCSVHFQSFSMSCSRCCSACTCFSSNILCWYHETVMVIAWYFYIPLMLFVSTWRILKTIFLNKIADFESYTSVYCKRRSYLTGNIWNILARFSKKLWTNIQSFKQNVRSKLSRLNKVLKMLAQKYTSFMDFFYLKHFIWMFI